MAFLLLINYYGLLTEVKKGIVDSSKKGHVALKVNQKKMATLMTQVLE